MHKENKQRLSSIVLAKLRSLFLFSQSAQSCSIPLLPDPELRGVILLHREELIDLKGLWLSSKQLKLPKNTLLSISQEGQFLVIQLIEPEME